MIVFTSVRIRFCCFRFSDESLEWGGKWWTARFICSGKPPRSQLSVNVAKCLFTSKTRAFCNSNRSCCASDQVSYKCWFTFWFVYSYLHVPHDPFCLGTSFCLVRWQFASNTSPWLVPPLPNHSSTPEQTSRNVCYYIVMTYKLTSFSCSICFILLSML